nr:hypothetical protein [Tanacetum cinerariifolium]
MKLLRVVVQKEMWFSDNRINLRVAVYYTMHVQNQSLRNILDVDFLWKETRIRQLMSSPRAPSAGPSTPPNYSSGPSTPPSYSSRLQHLQTILHDLQEMQSAQTASTCVER